MLLLVVFRSLPAALVTLLPAGAGAGDLGRLIGALGAGGLQVSSITQILLIVLLLGAGTDYGLFLVFRVREELRDGQRSARGRRARAGAGRASRSPARRER